MTPVVVCAGFANERGGIRPCQSNGLYPDDRGVKYCLRHHPKELPDRLTRLIRRRRMQRASELAAAYGTSLEAIFGALRTPPPITLYQLEALERAYYGEPAQPKDKMLIWSALSQLSARVRGADAPIRLAG